MRSLIQAAECWNWNGACTCQHAQRCNALTRRRKQVAFRKRARLCSHRATHLCGAAARSAHSSWTSAASPQTAAEGGCFFGRPRLRPGAGAGASRRCAPHAAGPVTDASCTMGPAAGGVTSSAAAGCAAAAGAAAWLASKPCCSTRAGWRHGWPEAAPTKPASWIRAAPAGMAACEAGPMPSGNASRTQGRAGPALAPPVCRLRFVRWAGPGLHARFSTRPRLLRRTGSCWACSVGSSHSPARCACCACWASASRSSCCSRCGPPGGCAACSTSSSLSEGASALYGGRARAVPAAPAATATPARRATPAWKCRRRWMLAQSARTAFCAHTPATLVSPPARRQFDGGSGGAPTTEAGLPAAAPAAAPPAAASAPRAAAAAALAAAVPLPGRAVAAPVCDSGAN